MRDTGGNIHSLGFVESELKQCFSDWTLHASPAPAHPSYRLMTALRLYHVLAISCDTVPSNADQVLQSWRNTTRGMQDDISDVNEKLWRATLMDICQDILVEAKEGIEKVRAIDSTQNSPGWLDYAKNAIEALWEEEQEVAYGVIDSLKRNEAF